MKHLFNAVIVFCFTASSLFVYGQGWVAEIDLNFSHFNYASENIRNVTFTFSGETVSDSSRTGLVSLTISGTGPITGDINLSVDGIAWDPYETGDSLQETISASFSTNFSVPCEVGFFEATGETDLEKIFIWIRVYPRLDITRLQQSCENLLMTSPTCASAYTWEVSNDPAENFKAIAGQSGRSLNITRDDLEALNLTTTYGRLYFRVTGLKNTTSELLAIDIYYPGPAAESTVTDPGCHGHTDGSILIKASGASPEITAFVITLFAEDLHGIPIDQKYAASGTIVKFADLAAGEYRLRVENNSNVGLYGNCATDYTLRLREPDPVHVARADITDFNGFQVSCHGANDGAIRLTPGGGNGNYELFQWTPDVGATPNAGHLSPGIYRVRIQDSNGCWSVPFIYKISAPSPLSVTLVSTGGRNGYGVSCADKKDGEIYTEVTGGVTAYTYRWSDGVTTGPRSGIGPSRYTITVTDANGCVAHDSITLRAPVPISFTIAETQSIACAGDPSGALEIDSLANAIGRPGISWSTGDTGKKIINKIAGTYRATVIDEQGCKGDRSYTLLEPKPYSLEVVAMSDYNGTPIRCNGEDSGALEAIVHDPFNRQVRADEYFWYLNGIELESNRGQAVVADVRAGVYTTEISYRESCRVRKSFELKEPLPVDVRISANSQRDTTLGICEGGALRASATGGTGMNYRYLWGDGTQGADLTHISSGPYTVTATDENGCSASVTETVGRTIDLGGSVVLCKGQTHNLDAGTGWRSQSWYGIHGILSEDRMILVSDPGRYILEAVDVTGCIARDTFVLETSEELLHANFLMPSEANINDTIVAIDITWPLPEVITWNLPDEMIKLSYPTDLVLGKFPAEGIYTLTLTAVLGDCRDALSKSITIGESVGAGPESSRMGHEIFVKQFSIYPNPNNGSFKLAVEFGDVSPVRVTIRNTLTAKKIVQLRREGSDAYSEYIDIRPIAPGSYSIQLDHQNGTEWRRFIVGW